MYLIEKSANINSKGPASGQTALHLAIIHGKKQNVALLLEANADFNIPDSKGKTAKDYDSEFSLIEEYCKSYRKVKKLFN